MRRRLDNEQAIQASAPRRTLAAMPRTGLCRSPADVLALQRRAGNRAVRALVGQRRLQRLIGGEFETRIPISTPAKAKYEGYPGHIAEDDRNEFHVDIDKATLHQPGKLDKAGKLAQWSVLECVVHPIDEHVGTSADAVKKLQERIARVEKFVGQAAQAPPGTPLDEVAIWHELTVSAGYRGAKLNMLDNDKGERLTGPVHFTIGVAPSKVPALAGELALTSDRKSAKKHAARAEQVRAAVEKLIGHAPGVDAQRVAGFMSLLYVHVGAMLDDERFGKVLIKNRTLTLPRVPFGTAFKDLPDDEQKWLTANRKALVAQLRSTYSEGKATWSRDITADEPAAVKDAFDGAFTGKVEDPSEAYGKMTVVKAGEWVGTGGGRQLGYAVELREFPHLKASWPERYKTAKELVERSRRLHGTDAWAAPDMITFEEIAPKT